MIQNALRAPEPITVVGVSNVSKWGDAWSNHARWVEGVVRYDHTNQYMCKHDKR